MILRKRERRGSIERKIVYTILGVGVVPILVGLISGYFLVREAQKRAIEGNLVTAAQKTASGLLLALGSRQQVLRELSEDPEIQSALASPSIAPATAKDIQDRFDAEGKSADDGPAVYCLYDTSGRLLVSSSGAPKDSRLENQWLDIKKVSFVRFSFAPEQSRHFARSVAPVFDEKGTRLGFISEDQGVDTLMNFGLGLGQSDDEFGTNMYQVAYVNEKRGGVLVSFINPDLSPPLQTDGADPRLQAALTSPAVKESGAMQIRHYQAAGKTQTVLLAYHFLFGRESNDRLYIVVYQPLAQAFSSIRLWVRLTVGVCLFIIGMFCVGAYRYVHNNVALPLALLNEGAQIIRQGDLALKLKIGTGDEIEELASSFNKMAQALSHNMRQLEESEEKYRSLVTSMPDGVYQTDPDGVVTFINPAGAEILGYERFEDALGQNLRELFLEEIDFARIASQLANDHVIERTRIWLKRKDGRAICVELSGNQVLNDEKQLAGIEGIFRDVTNSVRLEQQARDRSERISAINQIANVINSSLEAGRLHESLVVELNKLVHFDYAAVTLIDEKGENYETRQLWPEEGPETASGLRKKLLNKEESCAAWVVQHRKCLLVDEFRDQLSPCAQEFPRDTQSCLCVPLYAVGRIIGTLNLGANKTFAFSKHDIEVLLEMTPHIAVAIRNAGLLENLQQSLEEVTRAREKLHDANEELKTLDEMKTNLLSNVSHELRTPLVSVMGYTDMIANRKVGPINDTQAEYFKIILRNVEKLVGLIENLLDFSRLHRGTEKLVFDEFDLVDCAQTSIQVVQPVADNRKIEMKLVASHDPVMVDGDKGKMGQVFNNLLSNAVKFNQDGGNVTIEINQREDSVEVAVSDTGIGIPAEALDKIFTRFYQYDSSSTRKYGGTGIGLSIAQDIVRLHGGRITVTSEVGKGSVFRFALPLTMTERSAEPPLPSDTHLLIELVTKDRASNLQLRDLLAPEGMDIVHAGTVESAAALAQKHHPSCILVDVEAPGGAENGHTILDGIIENKALAGIPIVMLTNDDALYLRYKNSVASRVQRDFRKTGLLRAIQYALSPSVSAPARLGNKILCVDDDPEILVFITRCLKAEGYEVDTCGSGQEALNKIDSRAYGLVLLDIAMPGLDGWEVCKRVKSNAAFAGLKIYLVTAKPIDRAPARIQESGADGYLLKPFKPEHLVELARQLIPLTTEQA